MSLQARLRVLEPTETWPSLYNAARERFWDGVDLATSLEARRTGAIYLLGYVAEMLLKVAFYRRMGYLATDRVDRNAIKNHAAWGRWNLHSISGLVDLLIEVRQRQHQAFDPVFAGDLRLRVQTVALHWQETLRYKHTPADEAELTEVFRHVDWLLTNADQLWS